MEYEALPGYELVRAGLADLEQGIERVDPDSAHSRYNALVRRLVRFERAAESAVDPRAFRRTVEEVTRPG